MGLIKGKYIKRGRGLVITAEALEVGVYDSANLTFITQVMIDEVGSVFEQTDLGLLYWLDAPADGKEYARKDGAWVETSGNTSGNTGADINMDGGHPGDVYLISQSIDGGHPGDVYLTSQIIDGGLL